MNKIKGALLRARLDWLRAREGDEALARVLGRVPESERAVLAESLVPSLWYPTSLLEALDSALAAELAAGADDEEIEELFEEAGEHVARQHARSIYRLFFRETEPDRVLRVAACVFSTYYSGLAAEPQDGDGADGGETPPRGGRLKVDGGGPSRARCRSTLGYFRGVLSACTEQRVVARETACRAWGDAECEMSFECQEEPALTGS